LYNIHNTYDAMAPLDQRCNCHGYQILQMQCASMVYRTNWLVIWTLELPNA